MKETKIDDYKIKISIDAMLNILENNFRYDYGKKIPYNEIFEIIKDLNILFCNYEHNVKECGELIIKRYIPLLDLLVKVDIDKNRMINYEKYLKNAYKLGARVSLEHYMVYREWDEIEKFFAPRYEIMKGYIHYLQEITYNPKFHTLIFNAPSGYGKLIANDVPILTKDGWKKHGDLKVGDYVISPTGEFIRVNIVHSKRLANVRVTFEDGEQIECHNQHEWQVYDRFAKKEKQVETTYLIKNLHEKNGRNRFLLPLRNMVVGEQKNLPIDPYTYGIWLGDGSTKQPRITQNINDLDIFKNIPYNITKIYKGINKNVNVYHLDGLVKDLHKVGLCYQNRIEEKYIHSSYLTSSIEQRLELLAGLIDTDGYLDKVKQRYIITTCGKKLRDDIVSLISTFGWRTSITTVNPITSSSGIIGRNDVYYIGFSPTLKIPCKLKRKKLNIVHKQRRIGFSKIELINPIEGNCITVDGGLYLVGKTLKTTHNTYPEKVSEAWDFGIDPTGTILSLCSNEDVVKGGSRTVIDEIKSEWFGEVFPKLKWTKEDKDFFLKETENNWKLRDCKLNSSYIAKTTQSNVVGTRASKRIHIDDLYPNHFEALNQKTNYEYFNNYLTVWLKRFVQNKIPKCVITGTLWANGDFIALVIALMKKRYKFHQHPKYKYTLVNEDETVAIIQVPALDYITGQSTCPDLRTTPQILEEKDSMDEYLFETNFQQQPTDPESLFFSYNKLRTYDVIPQTTYLGSYSVIDATRKSGKDFFGMPIFSKVPNENNFDYYLKDCLFTRTATKDMYEDIIKKIIEHHIIILVIESNVSSELKQAIDTRLKQRGIFYCEIIEKYNTIQKATRIESEKGIIKRQLVFPQKGIYGTISDMGLFMNNLTLYNNAGTNPNDDAPDCCALFASEIIEENSSTQKAQAIPNIRKYF